MKRIIYKLLSKYFLIGCSHYNPPSVRRACRSKIQAKNIFTKFNLPVAQGRVFYYPWQAISFVKRHGFPVVIKPNVGGFSRGAYFPIHNYFSLISASIFVKKWWLTSIIEKYLAAKNYRILVVSSGVMSIVRRYPPFVIGNGRESINSLIDYENHTRRKMYFLGAIHPIPKNREILHYLRAQHLNLDTIPALGNKIYLHNKITLKLGGAVKIVDKARISANNQDALIQILEYLSAHILGIDVICERGLSVDFNAQKCIFLEINSRPFLEIHNFPRYGRTQDLSTYYEKLNQYEIDCENTY